jgi:hypothetical protein
MIGVVLAIGVFAGVPSPRAWSATSLRAIASEPDADTRERAAQAFAAGERAYEAEKWEAAVEHFEEAQELAPHPFTQFNLGLAQARAGRTLDAWRTFDALARHAEAREQREEARQQQEALRRSVAMIRVSAQPGAVACLDGVALPLDETTVVLPGPHRLRVGADERALELEGGETRHVDVRGVDSRARAIRPLLGVAIGAGVLALGTGLGTLGTDDRSAELGLGITAGTAAAIAVGTTIAALVLHVRPRKAAAPTCATP